MKEKFGMLIYEDLQEQDVGIRISDLERYSIYEDLKKLFKNKDTSEFFIEIFEVFDWIDMWIRDNFIDEELTEEELRHIEEDLLGKEGGETK